MKEPASAHHRGLDLVIGLCSLGLLTPLVLPLATGRVFVQNDLTWFHLPMRYLYQQALRAGDTVLWTPSILAGFYVQGEGQTGMFHPVHQLLYRLLPLGPAFNLELIGSYPLAFGGMYWFLRRLEFSVTASLWGAMLFAFSGFTLLHHHHMNMVEIVAHLPWLLAAADVAISDDRPRATGGLVDRARTIRLCGIPRERIAPLAASAKLRRGAGHRRPDRRRAVAAVP
jgi:hypothetical protein